MTEIILRIIDLNRRIKRILQVLADILLVVLCFFLAMVLRLEHAGFISDPTIWFSFLPVLPVTIFVFAKLGLYRSIVRYISGQALLSVGVGVLVSAIALFASLQVMSAPIPRSVPGIYALLLLLGVGGLRFAMRSLLRKPMRGGRKPVLIYGAGDSGRQLQNALLHGREFVPLAFIDDDPAMQQALVGGIRVYPPQHLSCLIEEMHVGTILLAVPSASRARRREIIQRLEPLNVEIKTIPGMEDIVSGRAAFSDLRRVKPEDLLGRDPVPERQDLMGQNITGKVVLVSGAGGSIGSELCRQIIKYEPAILVLFELSEFALYSISMELREAVARKGLSITIEPVLGTVQSPSRVRAVLSAFNVQSVYHAAAYKHVVLVEENVVEGVLNNVFGTQVMAKAAAELEVENFIMISTDKAVRPTNFMGASKRMAELVCQALAQEYSKTTFSMVRFGNVLGSSGSVIPRFRAQIEAGGPVTVTHRDITRYFMTIPEAAQLVIQAGAMAKGGDVFVLDMGEPVKILDLAQSMIWLHGLKPYLMDEAGPDAPADGDIGIKIVGLNKGEKLYEELLIGDNPCPTDHPRIMSAMEVALSQPELSTLLGRLQNACRAFDIAAIRQIFLDAPLAYRPSNKELHDLMWTARHRGEGKVGSRSNVYAPARRKTHA